LHQFVFRVEKCYGLINSVPRAQTWKEMEQLEMVDWIYLLL